MLRESFRILIRRLLQACPVPLPEDAVEESRHGLRAGGRASHRGLRFAALCCFIGAVSVHDSYLLLHNRQDILDYEKNPVGRWLIEAGGGDVMLFVAVKLKTTAVVCSLLVWMYQRRPQRAQAVAAGVAAFQFGLLLYLTKV